jgi:hypothetical protein
MVVHIKNMANAFKQHQKTIHYAITYLDIALADPDIFTGKFNDREFFIGPLPTLRMNNWLLAATCLLLASKFYEIDDNLILSGDIRRKFKNANIQSDEFKRAELQVLEIHKWDLHCITVLDFV